MDFKKEVKKLEDCYESIETHDVDISQSIMPSLDFSRSRQNLYLQQLNSTISNIEEGVSTLDTDDEETKEQIKGIVENLRTKEKDKLKLLVKELVHITENLELKEDKNIAVPSNIPSEIFREVEADINEMTRCFNSGCYRSAVIICGRILEIVLHRKYYEMTENDLLEKSPGIGLGNLIKKMKEKEIQLDPGLTQQIHLINQVRVFSVHKKQKPFYPSRAQTQAMILYTTDVLEKLF